MRKQETMVKELLKTVTFLTRDKENGYIYLSNGSFVVKMTEKAITSIYGDINKYTSDTTSSVEINNRTYFCINERYDMKDFCKDMFKYHEYDSMRLIKEYKVKRSLTEKQWKEVFNSYDNNSDCYPVYLNPEANVGFSLKLTRNILNLICTDTNEVSMYVPYIINKLKNPNDGAVYMKYTDNSGNLIEVIQLGVGKLHK